MQLLQPSLTLLVREKEDVWVGATNNAAWTLTSSYVWQRSPFIPTVIEYWWMHCEAIN